MLYCDRIKCVIAAGGLGARVYIKNTNCVSKTSKTFETILKCHMTVDY